MTSARGETSAGMIKVEPVMLRSPGLRVTVEETITSVAVLADEEVEGPLGRSEVTEVIVDPDTPG